MEIGILLFSSLLLYVPIHGYTHVYVRLKLVSSILLALEIRSLESGLMGHYNISLIMRTLSNIDVNILI
jgi:hypothetical protein